MRVRNPMVDQFYRRGPMIPLRAAGELTQAESDALVRNAKANPLWIAWQIAHMVSIPVLAYHGYKRNDSVGWAVVWGLFGAIVWPITVPISVAQGYARRRVTSNRRKKGRRSSRRRTSRRAA